MNVQGNWSSKELADLKFLAKSELWIKKFPNHDIKDIISKLYEIVMETDVSMEQSPESLKVRKVEQLPAKDLQAGDELLGYHSFTEEEINPTSAERPTEAFEAIDVDSLINQELSNLYQNDVFQQPTISYVPPTVPYFYPIPYCLPQTQVNVTVPISFPQQPFYMLPPNQVQETRYP